MPQTFTQETEARTALYYTKGGIVADTPLNNGIGITVFNIAGHTGFHGILAENSNPLVDRLGSPTTPESFITTVETVANNIGSGRGLPVQASLIDGAAAIYDLQATIRAYFDPSEQPETSEAQRTQDLQLEFLNLSAPTSAQDRTGFAGWLIHPHRNLVSVRQDATRPFLYSYAFQFAGIARLNTSAVDATAELLTKKDSLRDTLNKVSKVVKDVTNGINTIRDAFDQLVMQQFTGPVTTLLESVAGLGDALRDFADDIQDKVRWPLYAQRQIADILEAPLYSVVTMADAAKVLGHALYESMTAFSRSIPGAGTTVDEDVNDLLTMKINGEEPVAVPIGSKTTGADIAQTIQQAIREAPPQHRSNTQAYRAFTATYERGQYTFTSGTTCSTSARVEVVVDPDSALNPRDASAVLGCGLRNGGQERPGSTGGMRAMQLLQGLEEACMHFLAFPDWFAIQLAGQDAALATSFPSGTLRPQIRGDQHLAPVRITPGDTLQSLAARVGVPWETLALINDLTYPYIILEPSTLLTGRASSADRYHLTDDSLALTPNTYQGQRIDLVGGTGTGQSRYILRHMATEFLIDPPWTTLPNDTTDYAIRQASNPIIQTSSVTSAGLQTLTDSSLSLVPDSQRGLTIMIATGQATGERRRIVEHDGTTYLLDAPWDVRPEAGVVYFVYTSLQRQRVRQRMLGDIISVPRPSSRRTSPGIRGRLEDVSSITGHRSTREEKLFGRDWLLSQGDLVWDPTQQDCVMVAGLANLRQAVINLVNVPLGQVEYNPGLGSYLQEDIGETATVPLHFQLMHSLERTIMQDGRIARLAGAQIFTQGGKTFIGLAATAISGDVLDRVVIR